MQFFAQHHTSHNQFTFKVSSSFTTMPLVTLAQYSWQVRKNLYQPNMCWYVTHLGNLATTGHPARPSICEFSFGTLYQHHLNVSRKADWSSPFRWRFSFCSFLKLCISNCLFKSKGRWMRAESSKQLSDL